MSSVSIVDLVDDDYSTLVLAPSLFHVSSALRFPGLDHDPSYNHSNRRESDQQNKNWDFDRPFSRRKEGLNR